MKDKIQAIREALEFYAKLPNLDDGYEEWFDDEGKKANDALASLDELEKLLTWQPIHTVPEEVKENMTEVLIRTAGKNVYLASHCYDDQWSGGGELLQTAVEWMPAPK